nr:hypothetical protein Iba_scaffold46968CG0010 [Ipomoea batatas]GMD88329.1 hypothetical protein Iba_chr14cCG6010 [Ipomoea batatas]GMD88331.1 hypothetical protein Iba_chr14cCG6030 [Ipomoea batatas]
MQGNYTDLQINLIIYIKCSPKHFTKFNLQILTLHSRTPNWLLADYLPVRSCGGRPEVRLTGGGVTMCGDSAQLGWSYTLIFSVFCCGCRPETGGGVRTRDAACGLRICVHSWFIVGRILKPSYL